MYPSFLVLTLEAEGVGELTRSLELENKLSVYLVEGRLSPSLWDDMPSDNREDGRPSDALVTERPSANRVGETLSERFVLETGSNNLDEIVLGSAVVVIAEAELYSVTVFLPKDEQEPVNSLLRMELP